MLVDVPRSYIPPFAVALEGGVNSNPSLPAETRGKPPSPPPTRPGRILENKIARYEERNQAETAEDAESTGEHTRIRQQAIFRFFPHFVVFDGFI